MSNKNISLAPMVFEDLEPIKIPVKLGTKDYMLCEASEDVAVKVQNARLSAARFNDGKLSSVTGAADVEPLLVQGCLFEVTGTNKTTGAPTLGAVSRGFVLSLKAQIVKELYKRAAEISNLDDKADTVEVIDKQIHELQQRRVELLKAKQTNKDEEGQETSGPKVLQEVTPTTSA